MAQNIQSPMPTAPPPETALIQLFFGGLMQKCICVAAKLGIADLLAKQPQSADELAAKTQTHGPSLYRILRALASAGIFAENEEGRFELTPLAALLQTDVPNSMHNLALLLNEEWLWENWGGMMHSVKTGETTQEK